MRIPFLLKESNLLSNIIFCWTLWLPMNCWPFSRSSETQSWNNKASHYVISNFFNMFIIGYSHLSCTTYRIFSSCFCWNRNSQNNILGFPCLYEQYYWLLSFSHRMLNWRRIGNSMTHRVRIRDHFFAFYLEYFSLNNFVYHKLMK